MLFLSCIKEKRRSAGNRNTSGSSAVASTRRVDTSDRSVSRCRTSTFHDNAISITTDRADRRNGLSGLASGASNLRAGGMRCWALCVVLLAISEPLLIHAKVVFVVPRHVRRSPAAPWRPSSIHYKKSSYGGSDYPRHAYYSNSKNYYDRKPSPYRSVSPYPPGGDDFDQGHEVVNHVHIPYGKSISHAISFGKGYIPYDNIKSNNLPFVHERYAGDYTRQPAVQDYPQGIPSVGQEYPTPAASHSYENPQLDSFFSDVQSSAKGELPDNLKDSHKYHLARSIEKDLSLRNQQALGGVIERDAQAKDTEIPKDVPPITYGHAGIQGAIVLPAGIPSATIAGNKDGVVLRDTVSMDEYHRKLEELTKTWPSILSAGGASNFAAQQQLHTVGHFPTAGLSDSSYSAPGTGWLSAFAQSKQGYDVREDQIEPSSYDFRTMPLHTASFQALPLAVNVGVSAVASDVHG